MDETTPFSIKSWESFYVIVGSSAGALTGLQFVVLTLISEAGALSGSADTLAAFGSPNVVHFCAALLVSAIFSAPWIGMTAPGVCASLCGIGGLVYSVAVLRRAFRQKDYKPVLEDWIWHAVLPIVAYVALLYAGLHLVRDPGNAEYIIGAAALLLVFIGIHNAWDTVVYVTLDRSRAASRRGEANEQPSGVAVAPAGGMAPPAGPSA